MNRCTGKQVSKLINSLKAKGYINVNMKYKENSKQIQYQKERDKIIADNEKLHKKVDNIKSEYKQKQKNFKIYNKINLVMV